MPVSICVLPIFVAVSAAAFGPVPSSVGILFMPWTSTPGAHSDCGSNAIPAGGPSVPRIETGDIAQWEPPSLDGGVDILAAGFSCKDISIAGRRSGLGGSQTGPTYQGCLTAIDAWMPTWIFFENSPEIQNKGLNQVRADIVARGYAYRDGIIAAADVGAPHRRNRWYLLAKRVAPRPDGVRELQSQGMFGDIRERACNGAPEAAPDPLRDRLQESVQCRGVSETDAAAIQAAQRYASAYAWNQTDSDLCRMAHGMASGKHRRPGDRGKRIAALGDAWVPLQAAAAWRRLGGPYDG